MPLKMCHNQGQKGVSEKLLVKFFAAVKMLIISKIFLTFLGVTDGAQIGD